MPNKAHRVAARQAELSRKKHRGKGRPQVVDSSPAPVSPTTTTTAVKEPAVAETVKPVKKEAIAASAQPAPMPARRARQRASAAPARSYLGAELRQIGTIVALIAVILVVLTFVLR
jgi:hypothetical protein